MHGLTVIYSCCAFYFCMALIKFAFLQGKYLNFSGEGEMVRLPGEKQISWSILEKDTCWKRKIPQLIVSQLNHFFWSLPPFQVFEPELIRNQMDFSCQVMLKMFLAAVSAVLVSMSALSVLPITRQRFLIARHNFICRLSAKGVSASAIGGILLGIGMTVAGAVSSFSAGRGITAADPETKFHMVKFVMFVF